MTTDPRAVRIVGTARRTWHRYDPDVVAADGQAPEPLDMWEETARAAADDAGAPGALAALESIDVVYSQSWQYDDAVAGWPSGSERRHGAAATRVSEGRCPTCS